jgi:hypothetical protein
MVMLMVLKNISFFNIIISNTLRKRFLFLFCQMASESDLKVEQDDDDEDEDDEQVTFQSKKVDFVFNVC